VHKKQDCKKLTIFNSLSLLKIAINYFGIIYKHLFLSKGKFEKIINLSNSITIS